MAIRIPSADEPVLAPGEQIGDLVVIAPRFRGGFAHLYEARLGDRRVALKLLQPHVLAMRGAAERLRLEAAALGELDHPHIVEVISCGEHHGWPYLAMEWLDGRSLADEVAERGALPLATVIELIEQIGSAVGAAHARGIVHRDLKAQNVVVLATGGCKLIDFGIAKLVRSDAPSLTTTTQVVGSPIAMAPEQIMGGAIDERTDIYALGALLYHLLTGRPAFLGASAVETEELHLAAEPPRASDVVALPAAIDAVIRRAMAKSPTARHASVAAFVDDLRDAIAGGQAVRRGAAVYVEADVDGDDDDDLDALDQAMVDAQRALRDAGLEVFAEANNALLAGAALPGDGLALRRAALAAAQTIAMPRMRVRIRIAVDALTGTACDLGPAAVAGAPPGVVATEAALTGVDDVAVEPAGDLFRVLR